MNFAAAPSLAEQPANLVLEALPEHVQTEMQPLIEHVQLAEAEVLCEAGAPIEYVYFPHDCLLSLLGVAEGRMTLEVGQVGREGMFGAAAALGEQVSRVRAVVQRAGVASRIAGSALHELVNRHPQLLQRLFRYASIMLAQTTQIAVCSRYHVLEARLARSLLVTRDRLQSDRFHLTHEFLAHGLGVRRVGVTKAASALQQQGLINYSRGNIAILDPAGLAGAACSCYALVKQAEEALRGPP